ncbi:hypothetical protein HDF26_000635 [Pedobacter cryoconitis]|uniref:Lipoprotein n=1 Tax=Pedobacter cryoconitis TaxID=188932 RepID=A0A7W9E198_9SPHI|nr:hypothetical protein [Pedobacter cryoconitis]MBB5638783.1 hypothetical protein [Pedobacter cryoconitis]MBB6270208.1 hypothetical protein [Pedobacter cryoconitis]
MNKYIKYTLIFISITGFAACINADRIRALFNAQLDVFKKNETYNVVQSDTHKALKKWINEDLEGVHILKKCNWKLDDAVFFNSKKDRCYLLLLIQDKNKKAELDYAYLMYGALEHDQWVIYFTGLPTMVFHREKADNDQYKPISMANLSLLSRDKILKHYYKANRHINDEYVNKAYNTELKKKQELFLQKKH